MATQESMAIRSNEALSEIEAIVSDLLGADVMPLARSHRDREMLKVIQLEAIAKWLGEIQDASKQDNSKDVAAMFEASMAQANFPKAPVATAKPRK
jgi:hypothetical protein